LGRTFFGLTSEHKIQIHKTLFSLAYYSNGAFSFQEVYNMPVYLRNFHMKQLEDAKIKETEAYNKMQKGNKPPKR
jgi:hypothetical protein